MNKKSFLRGITAASLAVAVFATSSLFAAAAPGKNLMGELTVTGTTDVSVNGESANTGRTVFSSNIIKTSTASGAIVNLGKVGRVELAPNSTLNLAFNDKEISGTLLNGRVNVSGAQGVATSINTNTGAVTANLDQAKNFSVSFENGQTKVNSTAGDVTLSENGKTTKAPSQTDDDAAGGFFNTEAAIITTIIVGAAATVLIYTASNNSNNVQLGQGGLQISPTR